MQKRLGHFILSSQGQKDYAISFFKSTKTLRKLYNLRTKRLPKMIFASKANSAKDPVEKRPLFNIVQLSFLY